MMPDVLAQSIQNLIERLRALREETPLPKNGGTSLEVNELVSSAAKFYEKVRYLIDYREEHTIRRSAIERILKRLVIIENQPVNGENLLKELAEGQYIAKEVVTQEMGEVVTGIVERFLTLGRMRKRSARLERRLLCLAASEIEQSFAGAERTIDEYTGHALYELTRPRTQVADASDRDVDVQLFCACRRALVSADNETLLYALWHLYVPGWKTKTEIVDKLVEDLPAMMDSMERAVKNPLQWQLVAKIKNESIYFHIVRELIRKKGGTAEFALNSPKEIESFAKSFLEEKYVQENQKLRSSGVRAVIYLILTKFIGVVIFELPYELFVLKGLHYVPLITNALFHPVLLLCLTRGIPALNSENTEAIITGMHDAFFNDRSRAIRVQSQHSIMVPIFGITYVALLLLLFFGIIGILGMLEFNIVSIALFMFFLALVSYFAFRIRYNAQRWMYSGRETSVTVMAHVLALPVVRTGRWLSQKFSSINVFVLFMDFIIETPFKLLLNFSSQFFIYLREKADDVY